MNFLDNPTLMPEIITSGIFLKSTLARARCTGVCNSCCSALADRMDGPGVRPQKEQADESWSLQSQVWGSAFIRFEKLSVPVVFWFLALMPCAKGRLLGWWR